MSDLLREIDEELQREHMAALWHKYKIPVLAVLALIVLGTASQTAWKQHKEATEISRSVALGSLGTRPGMTDAEKGEAFNAFANTYKGSGQAVLAQMSALGFLLQAGKKDEALQGLEALAHNQDAPLLVREYAKLVRVEIQLDTADPTSLRQQLEPLAAEGQPWRFTARMLQGLLFGKHGDYAKAKTIFTTLSDDANAPVTLRDEAKILARYYGTQG